MVRSYVRQYTHKERDIGAWRVNKNHSHRAINDTSGYVILLRNIFHRQIKF
jgi:hypothetical protein